MSVENDIFPTVSVDRSYANLVSDIDVDLAAITEYLRTKGLSDSEIMSLSIAFSGTTAEEQGANGLFNKQEKRISLHQRPIDEHTSVKMTKTLVHELEHFAVIFDDEFQVLLKEYYAGMAQTIVNEMEQGVVGSSLAIGERAMKQLGELGSTVFRTDQHEASWKTVSKDVIGLGMSALSLVGMVGLDLLISRRLASTHAKKDAEVYKNNPDEIRAHAVADDYSGQPLVSIEKIET